MEGLTPSRGERLAARMLGFIPERLALNPERVLINAACIIVGLSAIIQGHENTLIQTWPWYLKWEWGIGMVIGGSAVLFDFLADGKRREVGRLGALAIAICCTFYAFDLLFVLGHTRILNATIFLAIAGAKIVRIIVSSGVRAHQLTRPEVPSPPPGKHEKPDDS